MIFLKRLLHMFTSTKQDRKTLTLRRNGNNPSILNWKQNVGKICILIFMLTFVGACSSSPDIKSIEILESDITLDVNAEIQIPISISPDNANDRSIKVDVNGKLDVSYKDKKITIHSQSEEGNFSITLTSDNASSTTLYVKVVDEKKLEAEKQSKMEAEKQAKLEAEEK